MKKAFNYLILTTIIISTLLTGTVYATETNSNISITETPDSSSLNLTSDGILLLEAETGDVLFEKNSNDKMFPASTTKLMTAVLVLEKGYLNELVTVSSSAVNSVPSGYVKAPLYAGEELRVEELLYALLLPSANDAANVLAEHISGSIPAFADLMNSKAQELGMTNTHFTNPSGIHDDNLFTTASDLSILARYAMKNEKLRDIVKTTTYTLPATSVYPQDDRELKTSNLLLDSSSKSYYYEYATGIKTGFTNPAGDCLVASAKKDGIEFIAVCLHSSTNSNGLRGKFVDCKILFDFAFDNYTTYYKDLQAKVLEEAEKQESFIFENALQSVFNDNNSFDFLRGMLKICAVFIIILAIKLLFFRKKKNRRRFFKVRKRKGK